MSTAARPEWLETVATGQGVDVGSLRDALDHESQLAERFPGRPFVRAADVMNLAEAYGPASPSVMSTAIVWARRRIERIRKGRAS